MLQLKNKTPLAAAIAVFPDSDGIDTLYTVVKATFTFLPDLAVAETPVPVVLADEYWGEPERSSLKYASELHTGKATTDVIIVGHAWAPRERPITEAEVMVSIAGKRKRLRVFGDRVWRTGGGFTAPQPFQSMPLVYERAFGGIHRLSDTGPVLAEERNPVGVGFRGKRSRSEMAGTKLPNLEDPQRLLERAGDESVPACLGLVAPAWLPRRAFAGTYDESWIKTRAPFLPGDFDPRFFNMAPPELMTDRFLEGNESLECIGVGRKGPWRIRLPGFKPTVSVTIEGSDERLSPSLETVFVEPDEERLCLTWRASVACDKKALKVKQVEIDAPGLGRLERGTR